MGRIHRCGLHALLLLATAPARAADVSPASNQLFSYILVACIAFAIVIALAGIRAALGRSTWSIADALSEEADITLTDVSGKPIPNASGQLQTTSQLRASSSRLIALIGLIAIVFVYLGFGLAVLQRFISDNILPSKSDFQSITTFLFAGATMFAPYIVNKFTSVFDWITPKNG